MMIRTSIVQKIKFTVQLGLVLLILMGVGAPDAHAKDGKSVKTIVIDAGHGGKDPGAIGRTYSTKEKDVALSVSLKLGKYIEEKLPDVKVIYTRDDDTYLKLYERAQVANKNDADLFISIHANSAPKGNTAYGSETFVLGLHKTEAQMEVAKRENAVIEMEDDADENYEFDPNSPEGHIILATTQNAFLEQSIDLAAMVQDQFTNRVKRKDRGVKQAGFMVLYKTTMPSILVELGFLSNGSEEKFLASEIGQDYMASALFRAVRDYKLKMESQIVEVPPSVEETIEPPVKTEEVEPDKQAVIFKVQVMASSKKPKGKDSIFKQFPKLEFEQTESGVYRYLTGTYYNHNLAEEYLGQVKEMGYNDAYLVAYHLGKKIPMNEALELFTQR